MRRIIMLCIASILLLFAGTTAWELIQNESKDNNSEILPSITPTLVKSPLISNNFTITNVEGSTEKQYNLETLGEYNNIPITSEKSPRQWTLITEDTRLEITMNINESSPFGSDIEPEVQILNTTLSEKPLYRIKVQENFHFYTDSYYTNTCGQKYCSNGLLTIKDVIDFTIYCATETDKSLDLNYCDRLVENLKER